MSIVQKEWRIGLDQAGVLLQTFLRDRLPNASLKTIRNALTQNCCQLNGQIERFGSRKLKNHDMVRFALAATEVKTSLDRSRILYQDDGVLVYDKPSGVTSDESGLETLFPDYILTHRLDKDTSGVILFAKTKEIAESLREQFEKHQIKKDYLAISDGYPKNSRGVQASNLAKKHWFQGQTVWGSSPSGVFAKTLWRCERTGKGACLIRCQPVTGKTHQIRVHLSELGHPILGDRQYAKQFSCPYITNRVLLHALTITFVHPVSKKTIKLSAPLPNDFKSALNALNLKYT
jgi:RluA family pseudouridine synthase